MKKMEIKKMVKIWGGGGGKDKKACAKKLPVHINDISTHLGGRFSTDPYKFSD
jgi:hypothetical protein